MEPVSPDPRVFHMVLYALPGLVELRGYCPLANMTAALVEAIVEQSEQAIGEPIRHTARKLFPKPLDRSIREEVELAWKAPKRELQLSNKLSRPNYTSITASRFPGPNVAPWAAGWAQYSVTIKQEAPQARALLGSLPQYAALSGSFMARADSPEWWTSLKEVQAQRGLAPGSLLRKLRFAADSGWFFAERLGWITRLGPDCAAAFGAMGAAEVVRKEPDGGVTVWITAEPFDFRRQDHLARYIALHEQLAKHAHP